MHSVTYRSFLYAGLVLADSVFDQHFTGKSLRFDYYHSGTAEEEHISLDRFRLEGEWPGRAFTAGLLSFSLAVDWLANTIGRYGWFS